MGSPPPARGAPAPSSTSRVLVTDHPRLRGEHYSCEPGDDRYQGSPPPARGAHRGRHVRRDLHGITPACAGSTLIATSAVAFASDHPRLRGEHSPSEWCLKSFPGSPPPARGARLAPARPRPRERITPACAGSTSTRHGAPRTTRDPSTLLNQGCYVKERRISFTPSRSTGSHGPPVMRKSSPCSLRAA